MSQKNLLTFVYVLLLTLCFTQNYVDYSPSYSFQIIVGIILVLLSFIITRFKNNKDIVRDIFKWFLLPAIIIQLYSIICILFGSMSSEYFSSNLSKYIPIFVAMSLFSVFGNETYKICVISLFFSWFISVFLAFAFKGIGIFPFAIRSGFFGDFSPIMGVTKSYFEIHDLMLSLGILIIYFWFSKSKYNKKDLLLFLSFIAMMILGLKRIAILGILIVFAFIQLMKLKNFKFSKRFLMIISICLIIGSYVYLYLIFSPGTIETISNKFGVNLMGRNYYYNTVVKLGSFEPSFIGLGRNAVTKILAAKYSYLRVTGVHNDILKMYIENGFFVFLGWILYFTLFLPKHIYNKYSSRTGYLSLCVIVYSIIVFATDNVENYFVFQLLSIVVIYDYVLKNIINKKEEEKYVKENIK